MEECSCFLVFEFKLARMPNHCSASRGWYKKGAPWKGWSARLPNERIIVHEKHWHASFVRMNMGLVVMFEIENAMNWTEVG